MRIGVIGAGVIGLCTAYYLNKQGHDVILLEEETGPGLVTSFGNGGCFTYSLPAIWNEPGAMKMFVKSLLQPTKAPIQFRLKTLPGLIPWGMHFLKYANEKDFMRLTQANQRLAEFSQSCFESLLKDTGIDCGYVDKGFLEIFEDEDELNNHTNMARSFVTDPSSVKCLTPGETIAYEPSLKAIKSKLAGAMLLSKDKAGDSHVFCQNLGPYLEGKGVNILYGTSVNSIVTTESGFTCKSQEEEYQFDKLVIAAGNGSPKLARMVGVKLPMQPSKGFSFTIPMEDLPVKPLGPIVDIGTKSGINPLGGQRLRYVGGAELAGFDYSTPKAYWKKAYTFFERVLPEIDVRPYIENTKPWIGFRPMSVDGSPMIGPTHVEGLYVNTAQGWMGWTLAAGSARMLAAQMDGSLELKPPLKSADYHISRFG